MPQLFSPVCMSGERNLHETAMRPDAPLHFATPHQPTIKSFAASFQQLHFQNTTLEDSQSDSSGESFSFSSAGVQNFSPEPLSYSRSSVECGMPSSIDIFEIAAARISASTSPTSTSERGWGSAPALSTDELNADNFRRSSSTSSVDQIEVPQEDFPQAGPAVAKRPRRYKKRRRNVHPHTEDNPSGPDDSAMDVAPADNWRSDVPDSSAFISQSSSGRQSPLVWVDQKPELANFDKEAPSAGHYHTFVYEYQEHDQKDSSDRRGASGKLRDSK